MTQQPIIRSLLETDLYKLTMQQVMVRHMATHEATYRFVCRHRPMVPLVRLVDQVNDQLDQLCMLRYTADEMAYLAGLPWFDRNYLSFLRTFQFDRTMIEAKASGDDLVIVAQGPQTHVMGFEMPVLAIVHELYDRVVSDDHPSCLEEARKRLQEKVARLQSYEREKSTGFPYVLFDFGLRRRFSSAWHEEVVRTLLHAVPRLFLGTSNVHLAQRFGIDPIGTMAHEYLQTFQTMNVHLREFQREALALWARAYRGALSIALTDTVGMDAFLTDFDLYFAKIYDGLRHDSGDPYEWGEKAIAHYERLGIDPRTKKLVFSDGLNVDETLQLHRHFCTRIPTAFGIGTNLTNDTGFPPLHIVMKLTQCNGRPTAKLSDAPAKTICDDEVFLQYLRKLFAINHPG